MQHPFDGIIIPEGSRQAPGAPVVTEQVVPSRRSFLRRVAAAAAGVLGLGAAHGALAQSNRGHAGSGWGGFRTTDPWQSSSGGGRTVTTFALGEEGGGPWDPPPYRPPSSPGAPPGGRLPITTYALGEEGGWDYSPPSRHPRHWHGDPRGGQQGRVTTFALGEEGGATTFALGEEGGGRWY